jgi:DNA-binding response OmpR family regulator
MSPRLRGREIVVGVADEPLRDALRRTLEREGAIVTTHAGALSLLESVSHRTPDACIVDVDLPELGGDELIGRIREDRRAMPILLVSAHLLPVEGPAWKGLPTLPLPFRRKELLEILHRVLTTAGAAS